MDDFEYRHLVFHAEKHVEEDCVKTDYLVKSFSGEEWVINSSPYEKWGEKDFIRWADLWHNYSEIPDLDRPVTLDTLWGRKKK